MLTKLKAFVVWCGPRAKAIVAGLGTLWLSYQLAKAGGITVQEVLDILGNAVLLAGAIYATPNGSTAPAPVAVTVKR